MIHSVLKLDALYIKREVAPKGSKGATFFSI